MQTDAKTVNRLLVVALILTLPCAYLGNRFIYTFEGYSDFLTGLAATPTEMWGQILAAPLSITTSSLGFCGALIGAIIPWVVLLFVINYIQGGNRRAGEEHGSARWATTKEVQPFKTYKNSDPEWNSLILTQNTGLAYSRDGFSMDWDRNLNVLVIGGSGAGKTRYFVKPNVCQMNCDYFITDPKGDLLKDTRSMLESNGYEIRCFNTFKPEQSLVYNPFAYIKTDLDVNSFAKLFISMTQGSQKSGGNDPFWEKSETMLYMALIAFLKDWGNPEDFNIGGLMRLMGMAQASEGNENFKSPLDQLFDEIETGYRVVPAALKSECDEIVTYHKQGLLTNEQLKEFSKFPSQEAYVKAKTEAEDNKRAIMRAMPGMAFPWGNASSPSQRRTGAETAEVEDPFVKEPEQADTGERRQGLKQKTTYVRNYDYYAPGYMQKADGSFGIAPEDDFALKNYHDFKQAAGKTLKSIIISCNVRLAPFSTAEVKKIVCGEDQMHLDRFGDADKKNAIFCIFEDVDQKTLGFLHGIMVYQCIKILCSKAYDLPHSKLPRCVNFFLDEYRSLNLPQDISGMISVIRSRNIAMSIILQGISQLSELYDEAAAKSIRACCDTLLFLGSGEEDTRKYVSDACGQQTVNDSNYSQSHGGQGSWSKSDTKIARALIDPAEVGKIPNSKAIVLIKGMQPVLDDKYHLQEHPNYKLLGSEGPEPEPKPVPSEEKNRDEAEANGWKDGDTSSLPVIHDQAPAPEHQRTKRRKGRRAA